MLKLGREQRKNQLKRVRERSIQLQSITIDLYALRWGADTSAGSRLRHKTKSKSLARNIRQIGAQNK